jgi:carboxypeptidase Q
MVDTGPLDLEGVPTMRNLIRDLPNDAYYFTFHHSAGDSMDIMNPDWMDDNLVMIASMMYIVADMD